MNADSRRSVFGKYGVFAFRPVKFEAVLALDLLEIWRVKFKVPTSN